MVRGIVTGCGESAGVGGDKTKKKPERSQKYLNAKKNIFVLSVVRQTWAWSRGHFLGKALNTQLRMSLTRQREALFSLMSSVDVPRLSDPLLEEISQFAVLLFFPFSSLVFPCFGK